MPRSPQHYTGGQLAVVIDCSDLDRSADFWTRVLGYIAADSGDDIYRGLIRVDGNGVELLLQQVAEKKQQKTGCTSTCAPATSGRKSNESSAWAPYC